MGKKAKTDSKKTTTAKPSSLIDTRVIYCGDKGIIALTVKDILEEQIANKLA